MRNFIGALKVTNCEGGIFITTGNVTDKAKEYAFTNNVKIISNDDTQSLFRRHSSKLKLHLLD